MGQNQSQPEPYHKRHYNVTNKQIQRQNSLSMSTPNLLLYRDQRMKRAATMHNNSTASLQQQEQRVMTPARRNSSSALGDVPSHGERDTPVVEPQPFIRLLPIESEQVYFDETDESDEDDNFGGEHTQEHESNHDRRTTSSPSFLDGALSLETRLSWSDSYDFHKTREEEQEDLSFLSPVSGSLRPLLPLVKSKHSPSALSLDHDYPTYFGEEDHTLGREDNPVMKRYQLFDRPVPSVTPQTQTHLEESDAEAVAISSRFPALLDAIREDDEEMGHSRKPSLVQANVEDREDRETSSSSLQPLQEANIVGPTSSVQQQYAEVLNGEVSWSVDRRIQEAVLQVEQELADRMQRLEDKTVTLGMERSKTATDEEQDGSSVATSYHSRGAVALRKEMLSSASQKVDDLDSRVYQMEYLVSFKLNDIETKVQELQKGHDGILQAIDHAVIPNGPAGQRGDVLNEIQRYRPIDDKDDALDDDMLLTSTALVDKASIAELRQELRAFGMRYHELSDKLLTDLMTQMREAKLMLLETVDEVDKRLCMQVDRIEAEMHTKLISDIENRIQERVRAMEQTSGRLERCFDKMEGRLRALETVLASKWSRPESMYQGSHEKMMPQELPYPVFSDPGASPESPLPKESVQALPPMPSRTISDDKVDGDLLSSASSHRSNNALRPARIVTSNAMIDLFSTRPHRQVSQHAQGGPYYADPLSNSGSRNLERSLTVDNLYPDLRKSDGPFSASLSESQHRPLAGGPKSAGYVASSSSSKPAGKAIRRPGSYKELLHFWKAGENTSGSLKSEQRIENRLERV